MITMTQAEFARTLGVARSYVTALKQAGRLVLTDDQKINVDASIVKIKETADPNRDDVVTRWAATRQSTVNAGNEKEIQRPRNARNKDTGKSASTFADARARNEAARADIAEMERDKLRGSLVERTAVEAAVEDVMTIVRQSIEQQPHRVAPLLVGQDLDAIRATLKQENNAMLGEMVREFSKRLRHMAGEEEA